jgi:hypothetical protein
MQWLMHMLAEMLRDEYAVYQYAFETEPWYAWRNSLSLEAASRELRREIIRVAERDELLLACPAFIGHSTGGLVARRAFVDESALWKKARFVFFGTPNYGSTLADLKNRLLRKDRQTHELAQGSDFIWRLNRDWSELPTTAVDGCLSIVGTASELAILGASSKWGGSDGVVRTPAAFLTSRGPAKYFVLPVPLGHGALKEAPREWRHMGSLQNRLHTEVPDPRTDLPILAARSFLDPALPLSYSQFWERSLKLFESFESEYHLTQILKLEGKEEYPDGKWRWKGMQQNPNGTFEETEESINVQLYVDLGSWDADFRQARAKHLLPPAPEFLLPLRRQLKELETYWKAGKQGALIMRLDAIDLPPLPQIQRLIRISENGEEATSLPKGAFLRQGERWVTLCAPQINQGKYRIEWVHRKRNFVTEFDIVPHCTSAMEIDGHIGSSEKNHVSVLSGDNAAIAEDFQRGLSELSVLLETRKWNVAGDYISSSEIE